MFHFTKCFYRPYLILYTCTHTETHTLLRCEWHRYNYYNYSPFVQKEIKVPNCRASERHPENSGLLLAPHCPQQPAGDQKTGLCVGCSCLSGSWPQLHLLSMVVKNLDPEARTAWFPLFALPFFSLNAGKLHNLSEPQVFIWGTGGIGQIKGNDAAEACSTELNTNAYWLLGVLHPLEIMRQVKVIFSLMGN